MEPVRGLRNREVATAARLHRSPERRTTGKTLIEGPNLLEEALGNGVLPDVVFALDDDRVTAELVRPHRLHLRPVTPEAMARLAGTRTPRGPVAVIPIPRPGQGPQGRDLLVAWGVSDPGNLGTMARIAAAFGWDLGCVPGTADPWSPKTLRAGAGAHFRLRVRWVDSVETLRGLGCRVVASVASGGDPAKRLGPGPHALLIGEESSGLPGEVAAGAEARITIPMPGGTESLNAAVAAAILVYELSKAGSDPGAGV